MLLIIAAMTVALSPVVVAFVTGPLVPFVVGLLTTLNAPEHVKRVTNVIVSLVVAIVVGSVIPETGVALLSWSTLANFIVTLVVSGQSYDLLWKPVLNLNTRLLPSRGFTGKR